MSGKGVFRDQSQARSRAGKSKRTLKSCRGKGKLDGVVLIDIDDDDYDEIILIDVPESMQQKFRGPRVLGKERNFPFPSVISVDDDNEEEKADFSASDDSSRKRGTANARNRYGLGPESDSCSYESDSSDCEVLYGSINELREQWSKASLKRKSSTDDQLKASTSSQKHPNVGVECKTDQPIDSEKFPFNSSSSSPASHAGPVFRSKQQTDAVPFNSSSPSPASNIGPVFKSKQQKDAIPFNSSSSSPASHVGPVPQSKQQTDPIPFNSSSPSPVNHVGSVFQSKQQTAAIPYSSSSPSPASPVGPLFQRKQQTAAIPLNGLGYMNPSPLSPKNGVLVVQEDIINGREKLKETDEYKRAVEEEWAATQRQLKIQSEEAQRLRKRKKAERMRLLDMERRQRLRLEEVRETEKKDEEYNNQKDQIRDEVRKNLKRLETTCKDLASLLRSLGIPVGGSSSAEVHAAYKRASLKFHPDRTSRMDVRQQVECEEKFKLISRMKEKFLSTK